MDLEQNEQGSVARPERTGATRALVTNDDGVGAPGLAVLAGAAARLGFDVVVAAPAWDSSGASASVTAVLEEGRFTFAPHEVPGFDGPCLAVDAAPAFITRAAIAGAFGAPPDIVLSGVNAGLNTGHATVHSGTVGAAVTASVLDLPGIAFSLDVGAEPRWDTADRVVAAVLSSVLEERPGPSVLNVNVPDVAEDELRELRPARLAAIGAVTTTVTSVEQGSVLLEYAPSVGDVQPGTDVALLREGHATVTALHPMAEAELPPGLVDRAALALPR
ncbi:5'/3'-nucleotidase SurE [Dermatobacter hominis]|uniref:5'/3'-nucleotidase SurE n=1 Tax=Dermatobacter hominis TaxID=2884263 RepID=UPI001D11E483|nr:5'/3'-nucleotidase SurE [Dermatobacter hominis]UDY35172.1 5'/3'-nucleotidase SurE [Dermatobacter hominis]